MGVPFRSHGLHARAARLGILPDSLRNRERRERLQREAELPPPPSWIGARIWPPLEPDHPALAERKAAP